jgi:omega-amidase
VNGLLMRFSGLLSVGCTRQSRLSVSSCMSMSSICDRGMRLGLCQMAVTSDKADNIRRMRVCIDKAAGRDSDMILLPEIWNGPYKATCFPEYAEVMPNVGDMLSDVNAGLSPSSHMLLEAAARTGKWIVGGSISECTEDNRIYNTCLIISPTKGVIGKHRKVHLFDIDVKEPKPMYFKESDTLTAGESLTVVDTPWGRLGIGICYDIRFPEMATVMRKQDVRMIMYPSAFNLVTGPAHWELLARARAVDNQVYVALCSPARVTEEEGNTSGYVAYGHSIVVDPWGDIKLDMETKENVQVIECDLTRIDRVRSSLPYWNQKRNDLYDTTTI